MANMSTATMERRSTVLAEAAAVVGYAIPPGHGERICDSRFDRSDFCHASIDMRKSVKL